MFPGRRVKYRTRASSIAGCVNVDGDEVIEEETCEIRGR